jgi:K+-sensing histidine kinase KdpD
LELKVEERTRELNEAYSTLEKANRELLTLDEAKTEFLRMINHEIRTPLTALDGYLHILREEQLPANISEMLDMVGKSSRRLERFLMVVLQITELLTRDHPVEKELVPFKELSDKAIEMNRSAIDRKKLTIRTVSDQPGAFIDGNPKLLRHCLSSLLENAVEHAPEGSNILLRMSTVKNVKVLEVMDEGHGFSDLALNNLFKFFSPGSQHVDENVGLALALSKLIMDAHQGQIEAFNHAPHGATVRLTFPLLPETETVAEK